MAEYRIKELMKKKGLTMTALAERMGVTQANMSILLSGKSSPRVETLEKVASALNVELRDLFVSHKEQEKEREDFCAMVRSGANTHFIDSLDGLERLVARLRENEEIANKEEGK